jgi:uncharacterized protein YfcZ (UPF0381/DUF406 family)
MIDPQESLQFEELLIALREKCERADAEDPCYVTYDIMKVG